MMIKKFERNNKSLFIGGVRKKEKIIDKAFSF